MRLLFVLCFLLNIFKSGSAAAFAHESLNAWWLQISEAAKCRTDSCPPHGCIELLPVDKNSPVIPGLGASLAKIRGLSAFHVGFSECGVLVACDDPNFRNNPIRMLCKKKHALLSLITQF